MRTKRETVKIIFNGHVIELPKLSAKRNHNDKKRHDGIAFLQALTDEEWERWEKNATLEWERDIL